MTIRKVQFNISHSDKGENQNKLAELSSNHFHAVNNNYDENLRLRDKTEVNLKQGLKRKAV